MSVDIIIPVYRDLALTQRCVESVLASEDALMGRVFVINDASPEAETAAYCRSLGEHSAITLVEHQSNLGFVASVNEGLRLAGARDVIILNSDTEVPKQWVTRLKRAAEAGKVATVTPFSNNATICSYPHFCADNPLPEGHSETSLDAYFRDHNAGETVEIPTGVGFCMYIARSAIDEVGMFDEAAFGRGYGEENDFCLRASAKGWRHLLCADLFVHHAGGASFGEDAQALQARAMAVLEARYPDYNRRVAGFIEQDPIEPLRHSVDSARCLAGEALAVLAESRTRTLKARADWYALDQARHQQVTTAHQLIDQVRAEQRLQESNYLEHLEVQRRQSAETEQQYQSQIETMREGYHALEAQHQGLEAQYRSLEQSHRELATHHDQLLARIREIEAMWPVKLYRAMRPKGSKQ